MTKNELQDMIDEMVLESATNYYLEQVGDNNAEAKGVLNWFKENKKRIADDIALYKKAKKSGNTEIDLLDVPMLKRIVNDKMTKKLGKAYRHDKNGKIYCVDNRIKGGVAIAASATAISASIVALAIKKRKIKKRQEEQQRKQQEDQQSEE